MSKAVYQFILHHDQDTAFSLLEQAAAMSGKIIKSEPIAGKLTFKIRARTSDWATKLDAVINSQNEPDTLVRILATEDQAVLHKYKANDRAIGILIENLSTTTKLDVIPGMPYIVRAVYAGGNTVQEYTGQAQGASLGGAALGGVLFGGAGAVVGGMSGSKRTYGVTKERFSNQSLFIVEYSNGKIEEIEAKKNSKLYNEIMVKLVK